MIRQLQPYGDELVLELDPEMLAHLGMTQESQTIDVTELDRAYLLRNPARLEAQTRATDASA